MERLINRRQQGDLGEASAIDWLTRRGAIVFAPLLDRERFDYLFVLVGDGSRWLIPATEIDAVSALQLGGPKYSEFAIDPGEPILPLVYGPAEAVVNSPADPLGEYPSGQRMATVNRPAQPSQVRILPPPLNASEASPGRTPQGQTRVSGNRQIVVPKAAFDSASLSRGDRLKAYAIGPGEILFRRVGRERIDDGPP